MLAAVMAVPAVPGRRAGGRQRRRRLAHHGLGHRGATGRGRRVVVGVAAIGGVPPVVTDRRRRVAGRRVVGGVAVDRGPGPDRCASRGAGGRGGGLGTEDLEGDRAGGVGARRGASVELMLAAVMAVPAVPGAGPVAVRVGDGLAHHGLGHRAATGRGRRVVVGVAAVGGVPPVVTDRRRRVAGRRVVGGVAVDRGPGPDRGAPGGAGGRGGGLGPEDGEGDGAGGGRSCRAAGQDRADVGRRDGGPGGSVAGPAAVTVGENLATTVSDMVPPQVEAAVLLLASPP